MTAAKLSKRIQSIDVLRGIAMVIMALDHVRDYFHVNANVDDPLNLATTSVALFFTRWITHYCAPIFIFLSGTSIYLQGLRKTRTELGGFLLKRGFWLILVELFIVSFGWTFNPLYEVIPFQVIWAIGISMIIMGIMVLIRMPFWLMVSIGIASVFGHNLLDTYEAQPDFTPTFWWDLLHHGVFVQYPILGHHNAMLVYPFLAWTGIMLLGYGIGYIYGPSFTAQKRKNILLLTGGILIVLFTLLRGMNAYGDPDKWQIQNTTLFTLLSFVNTSKYPPSLLYFCMTIGPSLILLALLENIKNWFTEKLRIFGRTAFFYYIVHLYLVHFIAAICYFGRGHTFADVSQVGSKFPFLFVAPGEGYGLAIVYLVWLVIVVGLYPLCKKYNDYKTQHKEKWWLSYL